MENSFKQPKLISKENEKIQRALKGSLRTLARWVLQEEE
jgi:hypothetical protein